MPDSRIAYALVLAVAIALCIRDFIVRRRRWAKLRAAFGQQADVRRVVEQIAGYHHSVAADEAVPVIDDRTAVDLHLDEVFLAIDHTRSSVGRQRLYHRIRLTTPSDFREVDRRLATRLTEDGELRLKVEIQLARLADAAGLGLWRLTQPSAIPTESWFVLFPILALLAVGSAVAIPIWPRALLVLIGILATHMIVRGLAGWRVASVAAPLRQVEPLLRAADGLLAVPAVAEHAGPRLLRGDLTQLARLRRTARWVSRDPSTENELVAAFYELLNLVFLLDLNSLFFGARELRVHGPALRRVIDGVGEIDVVLSVASLRASRPEWTRPDLPAEGPLDLGDVTHPLVDDAVPNSIWIGPGTGVILTGANMSGKTTFVRTVGVAVVLAQAIDTCLATRYRGPWVTVRSCIGRSDDLMAGKGYYQVEVEAVLGLVHGASGGRQHLLLFDELFRGTNTVERLAAGEAVLEELVRPGIDPPAFVIAATHDGELVDLLAEHYQPYHFEGKIDEAGLHFDYRLKPGPARERNAIALLELAKAPRGLVAKARQRAAELDRAKQGDQGT